MRSRSSGRRRSSPSPCSGPGGAGNARSPLVAEKLRRFDAAVVVTDADAAGDLAYEEVRAMLDGNVSATKAVRDVVKVMPSGRQKTTELKPGAIGKKAAATESAKKPPASWGDLIERRPN